MLILSRLKFINEEIIPVKILLLLTLMLFSLTARTQSLSFLSGYARNVNSMGTTFNFIPVELRWHPFHKNTVSFWANYDFGFPYRTTGDAYTLNPDIPSHVVLKEKLTTHILTVGIAFTINLVRIKPDSRISLTLMPVCLGLQPIHAIYKGFDSRNYEILNQDINEKTVGLVTGMGINYLFNKHMVLSINVQSPPLKTKRNHSGYEYSAPLRLMFGYRLSNKKEK